MYVYYLLNVLSCKMYIIHKIINIEQKNRNSSTIK